MFERLGIFLIVLALMSAACTGRESAAVANNASNANAAASPAADSAKSSATPSNQITEADIAKLKWLEGTWRGMDGQKPFFERIRFEGTTMVVETFADGTLTKVTDTARFELKDGEFGNTVGNQRSAASFITDNAVQFVPDSVTQTDGTQSPVKGHTFRFEKQTDGTWHAILDTPAVKDNPAGQKTYKMEPWKTSAK